MGKALCMVSGMTLILAGCVGLLIAFTVPRESVGQVSVWSCLWSSLFFSGPILIVAGGWLYTFKKTAWKLALVAYGILLLYLTLWNAALYATALYMSYSGPKPQFFSLVNLVAYLLTGVGTVFQGLWLICACLICILVVYRRHFKH